MKYSIDFVLKVNEIYHDVEEDEYEKKHPDIFREEVLRWQRIGGDYIENERKTISLLDIGSGTGFVPLQVGGLLKKNDLFICSDISKNILAVCKKNISGKSFNCKFNYLKLNGLAISLETGSVDCVTINAVLHHIPNLGDIFNEINRLLKVGGRIIIAHEPNREFFKNKLLWNNYKVLSFLFDPGSFIEAVLKKIKLYETTRKIYRHVSGRTKPASRLVDNINKQLIEEGITDEPLTEGQIIEITDIHSPTAGGFHKDRGIDMLRISKEHLANFEIEYLETYNHLCKVSSLNRFTKWYDSILRKVFPVSGSSFSVVLKKQH